MIYPANFEQKIGFDRLREQVAARCTMRAARARLAGETFSTSAREIARRLTLADEMRLLLDMEHEFPGGEYPDVDHIVAKLRVEGSFLDVEEVASCADGRRRHRRVHSQPRRTISGASRPQPRRRGLSRNRAADRRHRRSFRQREGQRFARSAGDPARRPRTRGTGRQTPAGRAVGRQKRRYRRCRRPDFDPRRQSRDSGRRGQQTQTAGLHPRRVGHRTHVLRRAGRGGGDQQRSSPIRCVPMRN